MKDNKRIEIQNECLTEINKHHLCTAAISMGVGKTYIGLKHMVEAMNRGSRRFLVVASKKSIFQTWEEEIDKHGFHKTLFVCDITYSTYRSINKHNPDDFDVVYLDECHNILPTHEPFLSRFKGRILGLTGTPPAWAQSEKGRLVTKYCPVVYTYITDDAIDDDILNDYSIIIHNLALSNKRDVQVKTKKSIFYTNEIANYVYWGNRIDNSTSDKNKMFNRVLRMKSMMTYKSKERYAESLLEMVDDKCIVFCNTTAQADKLCKHSYHSKNKEDVNNTNLDMFKKGDIDRLSCVLQLSEGVNIPNLKTAIILHAYGNEKKLMQRLGRMLRLKPGEKAIIHILCYENTVDETWVDRALEGLDENKIKYYHE